MRDYKLYNYKCYCHKSQRSKKLTKHNNFFFHSLFLSKTDGLILMTKLIVGNVQPKEKGTTPPYLSRPTTVRLTDDSRPNFVAQFSSDKLAIN